MSKIGFRQHQPAPDHAFIDKLENLILIMPQDMGKASWPSFPYADILRARLLKRQKAVENKPYLTFLPNKTGTQVNILAASTQSTFDRLTKARDVANSALENNPTTIAIYAPTVNKEIILLIEAVVAALLAHSFVLPTYKSKATEKKRLKRIDVIGLEEKLDLSHTFATAEGNNLARELTILPANELTPEKYRNRLEALAQEHGWKTAFLDIKTLRRKKAGAFLAVAQGSPRADAGIMRVRYIPAKRTKKAPLALVGKGICFDTGGTNLKPAKHMFGMHTDMEGSAVALGALLALTRLEVDFPVDCWLALAENDIGPNAYRQNEVVTASNGTTIEIVHTDAEGRMVLADTLALACAEKPGLIIDYATLTGACIYSLGTTYSGGFTNREALQTDIIRAGRDSGERVWPFPMDDDFDTELESEVADIKQCTIGGEADHILAARFLSRFIDSTIPWVHLDLSAGMNKGGLAHIPSEITGFGVRFTLQLLASAESFPAYSAALAPR